MDRKELFFKTLKGEKTDRIPCGFWHHYDKSCFYGEKAIEAHINFSEALNPDMLKIMNEYTYKISSEVNTTEDWGKLSTLKFEDSPYVPFLEECKSIKKALPLDMPLFATFHGVLVSAYHATETPGFFSNPNNKVSSALREDPELVVKGLKTIAETLVNTAVKVKEAGIDGIYYASLGAEDYRFSCDFLEKYVVPLDRYVIDAINDLGLVSILHICKDKVQLPAYKSVNANVVNWAVHDCKYALSDGRDIFPNATMLGGFDDRSGELVTGTDDEIIEKVKSIVSGFGREKLIIGTDCTLPEDIDYKKLKIVFEEAKKY